MNSFSASSTGLSRSDIRKMHVWREAGLWAMLTSEVVWLVPWFLLLDYYPDPALWLAIVLPVLSAGASMLLARVIRRESGNDVAGQFLLVAALVLLILINIQVLLYAQIGQPLAGLIDRLLVSFGRITRQLPVEMVIAGITLFAWLRGIRAAYKGMSEIPRTGGLLSVGIFSLIGFLLLNAHLSSAVVFTIIVVFFLSNLAALTLSRSDFITRSSMKFKLPMHIGWVRGVLTLTALTVVLGFISGQVLLTPAAGSVAQFFGGIVGFIWKLFGFILTPIIYAFSILVGMIFRWLVPYVDESNAVETDTSMDGDPGSLPFLPDAAANDGLLSQDVIMVLVAAGVFLLALLLIRVVRRKGIRNWLNMDDQGESIADRPAFGTEIRRYLNALRDRLGVLADAGALRQFILESTVRRIYAQMLRYGARLGVRRDLSETPLEYEKRLRKQMPLYETDIRVITQSYNEIRYGEFSESEAKVASVRAAWARLRTVN